MRVFFNIMITMRGNRNMRLRGRIVIAFLMLCAAAMAARAERPLPVYVAELSNINDYCLFANGGWDGNWYVGFNVCWMEELPAPPAGVYERAFVGVKLGRGKTRTPAGKPSWEKEPIPGSIYAAVSSTPAWRSSQKKLVADARDIPLEGDPVNAAEGVGEGRWFWAEVPVAGINMQGPNFVAVWSPTSYFVSASSSPIIAGAWGSQRVNSWMNNDIKGYAPLKPESSLKMPITMFEPAIALKLIPVGCAGPVVPAIASITDGRAGTPRKTIIASVPGDGIAGAWLELSADGTTWEKHGRRVNQPPFMFTLDPTGCAPGPWQVRCCADDVWGNTGASMPVAITIDAVSSQADAKK